MEDPLPSLPSETEFKKAEKPDSGFLDHVEELRRRLLISLAAIGVFSLAAYFFSGSLIHFLTSPLRAYTDASIYFHAPYEAFMAHLKVSLLAGLLAASPVFFTQLWLFISPGLYPREKKIVIPLAFMSVLLFLLGAAFAFWILIPLGLRFLLAFQTEALKPLLGIGSYFSFLIGMILVTGIVFDLPVAVLGLVKMGLLNTKTLTRSRRGMIVVVFILAAILTPSPDPVSQLLLAIPLILLYEGSVWVARRMEKR